MPFGSIVWSVGFQLSIFSYILHITKESNSAFEFAFLFQKTVRNVAVRILFSFAYMCLSSSQLFTGPCLYFFYK
jgi:hypothetical protein